MLDTSFHFFLSSLAIIPPSDTPRVDFGTKAAVYAVHCDSSALAETLSQMLWCVRLAWAFYFAIFISRFFSRSLDMFRFLETHLLSLFFGQVAYLTVCLLVYYRLSTV